MKIRNQKVVADPELLAIREKLDAFGREMLESGLGWVAIRAAWAVREIDEFMRKQERAADLVRGRGSR